MSAFKTLKKSDVYVTPYIANKQWSFTGSRNDLISSSIYFYRGISTSGSLYPLFDPNGTDSSYITNGEYDRLVYNQIKQLYYSNFTSGAFTPTSSYGTSSRSYAIEELGYFDNTNQSTLKTYKLINTSSFSFLGGAFPSLCVLSIPQNLFGSKIVPTTFQLSGSGTSGFLTFNFNFIDDGEGNVYDSLTNTYQGNIIYSHGIVVFNTVGLGNTLVDFINDNIKKLAFKGEHIVYENEIRCHVREDEFNLSQNPSTLDVSGSMLSNVTGSDFSPYVTTVGLYNGANELLAVGKFAKPIPMSPNTDMTFVVRYDM